jgi:hypothetical protein
VSSLKQMPVLYNDVMVTSDELYNCWKSGHKWQDNIKMELELMCIGVDWIHLNHGTVE